MNAYNYDRTGSALITPQQAQELSVQLHHALPRGSGPYGTRTPDEKARDRVPLLRVNGARQMNAWVAAAEDLQRVHKLPAEDERVIYNMKMATAWYRWCQANPLPTKEPKRYPKINWEAVT